MSARALSLFTAVSVLWGIPYLLIKLGINGGFTPISLVWLRLVLASAMLLPVAARAGTLDQLRGRWKALGAYAVVEIVVPFPMVAIGERHIASSLAAIVIATVPLLVLVLSFGFGARERVTLRQVLGLVTGLTGVVVLVGLDATSSTTALLCAGAVFIAAVGYALGPLILRTHLHEVDPRASMGVTIAIAAIVLTPAAAFSVPSRTPTVGAFAAVAGLAFLCSAVGFVLMAHLISEIGASRAVVITYVNPVIALACGVAFLGERPGVGAILGLVLILAGSWASAVRASGPPPLTQSAQAATPDLSRR